jgi:hypothetical protein
MPEIRTPITTPTNFITTTGTDVGSSIGHSTLAEVRAALGIASGFTYDQQAEPSSPAAGQTWRERTAGGLIVEEWEWTGSVWAALNVTNIPFNAGASNASTLNGAVASTARMSQLPFRRALAVSITYSHILVTADASNRWDITFRFGTQQDVPAGVIVGTDTFNVPAVRVAKTLPLSGLSDGVNENALYADIVKVDSPSSLTWGGAALVRRVRV